MSSAFYGDAVNYAVINVVVLSALAPTTSIVFFIVPKIALFTFSCFFSDTHIYGTQEQKREDGGEEGTKGGKEPTLTRRCMFEMPSDSTKRQRFVNSP